MRLNKRVVESLAVVCTAGTLSITAIASPAVVKTVEPKAIVEAGFNTKGIAGVACAFNTMQLAAYQEVGELVTVERVNVEMVTASKEEESSKAETESKEAEAEPELTEEEKQWQDKLMTVVDDSLNVRESGSSDAAVAGRLRKGDLATVVEVGEEWTLITSGNLTGYVSNEYCVFGTEAMNYAKANCPTIATAQTDCLRVRPAMNTEGGVVKLLKVGDVLTVDTEAETQDGWVAVICKGNTCYVSSEFVTVELQIGTGITAAEEAAIAAEKARREAEEAEQRAAVVSYGASLAAATDEVTLLACLIQAECGTAYYDAQVAVGAVVCNRVKSGAYPSTIYDVIYQSGQFGPARNGTLANIIQTGASGSCYEAAQAALSGLDNTGGLLHFNAAASGHGGIVIGNMVFY